MQELPNQAIPPDPENNWGALPQEPCQRCHQQGGVQFLIDNSDWGRSHPQVVHCVK
jgi:hypothetical protein